MLRIPVDRLGRPHLDDPAEVQDRDPVAEELRSREIMCDVEIREPELVLELQHELENLGAHAHVEHRDGLVGDE